MFAGGVVSRAYGLQKIIPIAISKRMNLLKRAIIGGKMRRRILNCFGGFYAWLRVDGDVFDVVSYINGAVSPDAVDWPYGQAACGNDHCACGVFITFGKPHRMAWFWPPPTETPAGKSQTGFGFFKVSFTKAVSS